MKKVAMIVLTAASLALSLLSIGAFVHIAIATNAGAIAAIVSLIGLAALIALVRIDYFKKSIDA